MSIAAEAGSWSGATNVELDFGRLLARHPELQIDQDKYNINVTANFGRRLTEEHLLGFLEDHQGAGLPAHLYFHVPLCSYICHFCNYVKKRVPNGEARESTLDQWTDMLLAEAAAYRRAFGWIADARIESFYIGGGTAALLRPRHLERLLREVFDEYTVTADCELTLEGNPDNFADRDCVVQACAAGFNRFSVGVQSFTDAVTAFTGREHDARTSKQAIENLLDAGVPFNVDLMFGLPHQTADSVEEDLTIATGLGVPTITIYRLRNADRHLMGIGNRAAWNVPAVRSRLHEAGLFPALSETYQMRTAAVSVLLEHGYRPSPCGWWNAPNVYPDGNIPRVSRNKWQRYDTMIAHGPGAYGWLTGNHATVVQLHNDTDIASYARRIESGDHMPLAFGRLLEGRQAVASALGFAFKANQPIATSHFRERYQVELTEDEPYRSVIAELFAGGLIEPVGSGLFQPTLDGEALHEEIISVYFHERIGGIDDAVCKR